MIKTWTSYQATFWNVLAPVDIVWVAQNQHNIELAISKSCKDNWDKISISLFDEKISYYITFAFFSVFWHTKYLLMHVLFIGSNALLPV